MGETPPHIDATELARVLRAAVSAVLLVEPRILRRVIKLDRAVPGVGLQVPHAKSYWLARDRLLALASREELGIPPGRSLPRRLVLLSRPDADQLLRLARQEVLARYWRQLLHVKVHHALEGRHLGEPGLRRRLDQLGTTAFDEIRAVLGQDHFLLPPGDDHGVYLEFAALYLEFRYFAPELLPCYFPASDDFQRIDALLAEDVNAERLFQSCRPQGATDPVVHAAEESTLDAAPLDTVATKEGMAPQSAAECQRLRTLAEQAAAQGNSVRAALLLARLRPQLGDEVDAELQRLCRRLQAALQLGEVDTLAWREALVPLLRAAAGAVWPIEARLLYDLQKACLDNERAIYAVDLVEWFVSLGRLPVKRLLPDQGLVRTVRHLRSAAQRLHSARITATEFQLLDRLLQNALHHGELRLRDALRPRLTESLEAVGMRPENLPERLARQKLVEELLDRVVARGFLTMGDLRDAISRNNLRLPDLAGPVEFVRGDRLIRANRALAANLSGIYRRGEIYLRWLQRFSSLAFGTRPGRFLTLFLALPFGGAYIALEGLQHLSGLVLGKAAAHDLHLAAPLPVALLGTFLLALLHVQRFRDRVAKDLGALGSALHWFCFGLPAAMRRLALIRLFVESRPFRLFTRYLLRPLAVAALAAGSARLAGAEQQITLLTGAATFLIALVLFNTRLGRDVEETLTDVLVRVWKRVRVDILPGLFRLVMGAFKRLVDDVERGLYTVDEALRFRTGDNRLSLIWKPIVGLLWFALTYVVRFSINLLVEPQINPIKHFPVVTVSHKLVLPIMATQGTHLLEAAFSLPHATALTLATGIGTLIPGIFGFLAWELKENWRLYRANQSPYLEPVPLGPHGETLPRLLRPGFHSGTLPKLYTRLRRALRRGNRPAFRRRREELHHVEESLRHFIDRDFLSLLHASRGWKGQALDLHEIRLGSNCIRVRLGCPGVPAPVLGVVFAEHAGKLVATLEHGAWLAGLATEQVDVLLAALAGLFSLSGVALVREPMEVAVNPMLWTRWLAAWQVDQQGGTLGQLFGIAWPGSEGSH